MFPCASELKPLLIALPLASERSREVLDSSAAEECSVAGECSAAEELACPILRLKGEGFSVKELVVWRIMRKCEGVVVVRSAASWCGEKGGWADYNHCALARLLPDDGVAITIVAGALLRSDDRATISTILCTRETFSWLAFSCLITACMLQGNRNASKMPEDFLTGGQVHAVERRLSSKQTSLSASSSCLS